jgi:hypothetical protein
MSFAEAPVCNLPDAPSSENSLSRRMGAPCVPSIPYVEPNASKVGAATLECVASMKGIARQ